MATIVLDAALPDYKDVLQSAIDAAGPDDEILLPAGNVPVKLPNPNDTINIPPTRPVTIVGQGIAASFVCFIVGAPPTSGSAATGFSVPPGGQLTLRALSIEGTRKYNFHIVEAANDGSSATRIRASRCRFTGGTQAIKMEHGPYFLEVEDCEFHIETLLSDTVKMDGMAVHAVSGGTVQFFRTRFSTDNHSLYLYPSVSVLIEDCTFERADGRRAYGIALFGQDDLPPQPSPYCIIDRCTFQSGVKYGIVTGVITRATISRCTFDSGMETVGNIFIGAAGADITSCQFTGTGHVVDGSAISDDFEARTGDALIRHCRFDGRRFATVYRFGPSQTAWRLIDCDFTNTEDRQEAFIIYMNYDVGATGGSIELSDCRFHQGPSFDDASHYAGIKAGTFIMRNCTVDGSRAIWLTASSNDVTADLRGNVMRSSYRYGGLRVEPLAHSITITGSENRFEGNGASVVLGTGTLASALRLPARLGDNAVPGALLLLPQDANVFPVLGSGSPAVISSIRLVGSSAELLYGPVIRVRLLADGSWSFDAAGNIRPLNLAKRANGSVAKLAYNAVDELWHEEA